MKIVYLCLATLFIVSMAHADAYYCQTATRHITLIGLKTEDQNFATPDIVDEDFGSGASGTILCGIDQKPSKSNLVVACSGQIANVEPKQNIRVRLFRDFNGRRVGFVQVFPTGTEPNTDSTMPLTCFPDDTSSGSNQDNDGQDSCLKQCGRRCDEIPSFCGQW